MATWRRVAGPALRWLCLAVPGALVLVAMVLLWQDAHSSEHCVVPQMFPAYQRVPMAEWGVGAKNNKSTPSNGTSAPSPPFALYRYRDQFFDDKFSECLGGTPMLFVPGHGGRYGCGHVSRVVLASLSAIPPPPSPSPHRVPTPCLAPPSPTHFAL